MPAAPDPLAPLDSESGDGKRKRELAAPPAVYRLPAPDTSDPAFIAEARRQAREAALCPEEAEYMDFIESISILFEEWE